MAAREQLVSEFPRQTFDRGILVAMLGGVGKKEQAQRGNATRTRARSQE